MAGADSGAAPAGSLMMAQRLGQVEPTALFDDGRQNPNCRA
jgi:hypothetical protein